MEHQVQSTLKGLKNARDNSLLADNGGNPSDGQAVAQNGLQILIQAEKDSRESNRITKLVKDANFRLPALIEELEINEIRGVPADIIMQHAAVERRIHQIRDHGPHLRGNGNRQVVPCVCPWQQGLQAGLQGCILHNAETDGCHQSRQN